MLHLRSALLGRMGVPAPAKLSGHDPTGAPTAIPHLAFTPLAFVNSKFADGSLKGAALVLPRGVEREIRRRLAAALDARWDLHLGPLGAIPVRAVEPFEGELQSLRFETYTEPRDTWATVTPLVLDRHPRKNGPDVQSIIAQSCERIGLPAPAKIRLGAVSAVPGAPRAQDFHGSSKQTDGRMDSRPSEVPEPGPRSRTVGSGPIRRPRVFSALEASPLMSRLDFAWFFHSVHGLEPLPWQRRLAQHLLDGQPWPDLIDLPTASGKTACIDIAVFHLAWCASQGRSWQAPRRIVFVVDRRIIVDSAFERAEKIKMTLEQSDEPQVRAVSEVLRALGGEQSLESQKPLVCQKLRGGMPKERGFAIDPAQPMVITSTVDQVGSRLLFRGYGLRSYAQPVHTGLLGHDTMILLDEAHLAEPFVQTVTAVRREQERAEAPLTPLQPVRLVRLSATASVSGERFKLDQDDYASPKLYKRLTTLKPARLVETSGSPIERLRVLHKEAIAVYRELDQLAPAIAVIVNRVKTARELASRLLHEAGREFDVKLVTGRCRPIDRDRLSVWLIDRVGAGRQATPNDRGLVVVATQALEVGADLDFQGLITECAPLPALRQRFGRLDRLGVFGRARAAIVGGGEEGEDPVYGHAPVHTWNWLNERAQRSGGVVDFSFAGMEEALKGTDTGPLSPHPRQALQLTASHVDLLCQTSPSPMHDPDVSALLHGFQSQQPEIQVVWRANLPGVKRVAGSWSVDADSADLVSEILSILPPSSLEALSLPKRALRDWLTGESFSSDLSDIEGASPDEEDTALRGSAGTPGVWRRSRDGWKFANVAALRPGDTIVLPDVYGGCDEFGFAPSSRVPVADLSQDARAILEREKIILITPHTLQQLLGLEREEEIEAVWSSLCAAHEAEAPAPAELWKLLIETLDGTNIDGFSPPDECLVTKQGALHALVLRGDKPGFDDISDEDLSSSRTVPVPLESHNAGVGQRARELAQKVGLAEQVETLGCAGDTHDLGKADPRFQRLLRAGDDETLPGVILGKGLRRVCSAREEPAERHEAYSVAVLRAYPKLLATVPDPELALYLVGVHHGRGRALMPFVQDDGTCFIAPVGGQSLQFNGVPELGKLGSGWPQLFWTLNKRYGPWGLAYLEALLRLADCLQSGAELKKEARP